MFMPPESYDFVRYFLCFMEVFELSSLMKLYGGLSNNFIKYDLIIKFLPMSYCIY